MDIQLPRLTGKQVKLIEADIQKAGISFSHLEADLLDHICCLVEELMEKGFPFELALQKTKTAFDYNKLKDIEIQTILLINQKFKAMKKTLKISGIAGISLFIIGMVFKINHFPGGSILLLLSVASLLFAYVPTLIFTVRRENILKNNRLLFYLAVASVALTLTSYLFTWNHWPFRDYLIVASWVCMILFLLIFLVKSLRSSENSIINMSMILGFTIILILMIITNYQNKTFPDFLYSTQEYHLVDTRNYFERANMNLYSHIEKEDKDSVQYRKLLNLKEETSNIIETIDKLRKEIFSDESQKQSFNDSFFKNYVGKNESAPEFGEHIRNYSQVLTEYTSVNNSEELTKFASALLSFDEKMLFRNPVIADNNLLRLSCDIRIIENELVQQFKSR